VDVLHGTDWAVRMSEPPWPGALPWPGQPLSDGVALLDRLTLDDTAAVAEACADRETQRWLPLPAPYTRADAHAFIVSADEAARRGQRLSFALRPAGARALAGTMSLACDDLYPCGVVGIGYWTAPAFRRQGLTWRGLRLAAAWAVRAVPDVRRLEVLVQPGNTPSRHVAERAGARFEGIRRNGLYLADDGPVDAAVYAVVPEDVAAW
jgi:RimJ/RimL family protein N-acetyltransferase